jgi:hypothetical protein
MRCMHEWNQKTFLFDEKDGEFKTRSNFFFENTKL